jgi:uncharacterized protein (TIGR00730 family)
MSTGKDDHPGRVLADSSAADLHSAETEQQSLTGCSASYRLAFADEAFLQRQELQSVRLQLEFLKPELVQLEEGINSTVVIFGSARIPEPKVAAERVAHSRGLAEAQPDDEKVQRALEVALKIQANSVYYDEARRLGEMITRDTMLSGPCDMVVVTGGGPGIMEAANRGAIEAGGKSIGLNIQLPLEQQPNPYITPELCFRFHYFAIRKMHFLKRATALVACPGGFGTMDELFDALTLIQTGKIKPLPVLLMGRHYWQRIINFEAMVEEGVISRNDLELFHFVDSAEEAWSTIKAFYGM